MKEVQRKNMQDKLSRASTSVIKMMRNSLSSLMSYQNSLTKWHDEFIMLAQSYRKKEMSELEAKHPRDANFTWKIFGYTLPRATFIQEEMLTYLREDIQDRVNKDDFGDLFNSHRGTKQAPIFEQATNKYASPLAEILSGLTDRKKMLAETVLSAIVKGLQVGAELDQVRAVLIEFNTSKDAQEVVKKGNIFHADYAGTHLKQLCNSAKPPYLLVLPLELPLNIHIATRASQEMMEYMEKKDIWDEPISKYCDVVVNPGQFLLMHPGCIHRTGSPIVKVTSALDSASASTGQLSIEPVPRLHLQFYSTKHIRDDAQATQCFCYVSRKKQRSKTKRSLGEKYDYRDLIKEGKVDKLQIGGIGRFSKKGYQFYPRK